MIIIDTSVWVEFFKNNDSFFEQVELLIDENAVLTFEPIFAELMQGAKSERERKILSEYWQNLPKFNIEGIFIKAGIESGKLKYTSRGIGLIDSAIIQLSRETSSLIWSLDKKLNKALQKDQIYRP